VIAASSHSTLGVDVMHRHEPIEPNQPMECDKENDDNEETAVANLDNIFWNHDWIVEINSALDDRSNRKHNRSYEGGHIVVAPECQCIASPPLCDSASRRDAVTSLQRRRTDAAVSNATEEGVREHRMSIRQAL
jgi:hypothetical protein